MRSGLPPAAVGLPAGPRAVELFGRHTAVPLRTQADKRKQSGREQTRGVRRRSPRTERGCRLEQRPSESTRLHPPAACAGRQPALLDKTVVERCCRRCCGCVEWPNSDRQRCSSLRMSATLLALTSVLLLPASIPLHPPSSPLACWTSRECWTWRTESVGAEGKAKGDGGRRDLQISGRVSVRHGE